VSVKKLTGRAKRNIGCKGKREVRLSSVKTAEESGSSLVYKERVKGGEGLILVPRRSRTRWRGEKEIFHAIADRTGTKGGRAESLKSGTKRGFRRLSNMEKEAKKTTALPEAKILVCRMETGRRKGRGRERPEVSLRMSRKT